MDERRRAESREVQLAHLDKAIEAVHHTLKVSRQMLNADPAARDRAVERIIDCEQELAILQEQKRLIDKTDPTPDDLRAMDANRRAMAKLHAREQRRHEAAMRASENA
jgi:hypothetical protein